MDRGRHPGWRDQQDHPRLTPHQRREMIAMTTGLLLVLEGGEGVGKTTQWQRLADQLSAAGHAVVALREPGGTAVGDVLRSVLLDPSAALSSQTEALLFAASRAELVSRVVQPALHDGAIVLVDRFLLSTYVYQGAGRGLPIDALRRVNHFATSGLRPDLTLLLTMSLDDALGRMLQRGSRDRMEREGRDFHERVHRGFVDATAMAWQARHPEVGPIVTVDANGSADEVTRRCAANLGVRWPERFASVGAPRG